MNAHLYAFGSICRGEADILSDIDLLACAQITPVGMDPAKYSIYSYERLRSLWQEGNPFAWHLHLESRLLYSPDGSDFLYKLGVPSKYQNAERDCEKFLRLFDDALEQLNTGHRNATFNLSSMFLAARNFATCYSFTKGPPIFSRYAPVMIDRPLQIDPNVMHTFVRARVLSTRGIGEALSTSEIASARISGPIIQAWMSELSPLRVVA